MMRSIKEDLYYGLIGSKGEYIRQALDQKTDDEITSILNYKPIDGCTLLEKAVRDANFNAIKACLDTIKDPVKKQNLITKNLLKYALNRVSIENKKDIIEYLMKQIIEDQKKKNRFVRR